MKKEVENISEKLQTLVKLKKELTDEGKISKITKY